MYVDPPYNTRSAFEPAVPCEEFLKNNDLVHKITFQTRAKRGRVAPVRVRNRISPVVNTR